MKRKVRVALLGSALLGSVVLVILIWGIPGFTYLVVNTTEVEDIHSIKIYVTNDYQAFTEKSITLDQTDVQRNRILIKDLLTRLQNVPSHYDPTQTHFLLAYDDKFRCEIHLRLTHPLAPELRIVHSDLDSYDLHPYMTAYGVGFWFGVDIHQDFVNLGDARYYRMQDMDPILQAFVRAIEQYIQANGYDEKMEYDRGEAFPARSDLEPLLSHPNVTLYFIKKTHDPKSAIPIILKRSQEIVWIIDASYGSSPPLYAVYSFRVNKAIRDKYALHDAWKKLYHALTRLDLDKTRKNPLYEKGELHELWYKDYHFTNIRYSKEHEVATIQQRYLD